MKLHIAKQTDELDHRAVYHQSFAVEYDYPVHFTENLFGTDNPVFAQVLSRKESAKRHRFVVFVDASVAAAWPTLVHEVASYAQAHGESAHRRRYIA